MYSFKVYRNINSQLPLYNLCIMAVHIGKKIQERAKETRIGVTELARMSNTSKQNIYGIFKRKSINTEQLLKLSCVLEYNFFQYYDNEYAVITGNIENDDEIRMAGELEKCKKELKTITKELEYLKEINELLKKR